MLPKFDFGQLVFTVFLDVDVEINLEVGELFDCAQEISSLWGGGGGLGVKMTVCSLIFTQPNSC